MRRAGAARCSGLLRRGGVRRAIQGSISMDPEPAPTHVCAGDGAAQGRAGVERGGGARDRGAGGGRGGAPEAHLYTGAAGPVKGQPMSPQLSAWSALHQTGRGPGHACLMLRYWRACLGCMGRHAAGAGAALECIRAVLEQRLRWLPDAKHRAGPTGTSTAWHECTHVEQGSAVCLG